MRNTVASTTTTGAVARATIVVTPRERFGVAVESLESIITDTQRPFELVYVDGNSPKPIAAAIARLCVAHGFRYLRHDRYLSPNQARNIGYRAAATEFVVFVDNDVIVSPGWLDALVACADETEAAVVAPLTCQKLPLHQEIHQAGGRLTDDLGRFLDGDPRQRRILDEHIFQGRTVDEVTLERGPTQCCEFHCALVRRAVLESLGGLDEQLLATKEHIDFCLNVWASGGKVVFEPKSIVTYLFPNRARPLTITDWPFFALRWSPLWQKRSLDHFKAKWQLDGDPYFAMRNGMLRWRHREGIARPLLRRIPWLGTQPLAQRYGTAALSRLIGLWSRMLATSR